MHNRAQAKHRKAVARRKKVRTERLQQERRSEFPPFTFIANNAEPGFVRLVREAVRKIDFLDPDTFDEWNRELYRTIARKGWPFARSMLFATARAAGPGRSLVFYHFTHTLDNAVYSRMPWHQVGGYLPMHELQTVPLGFRIGVNLRSLQKVKGAGGTVYHSSHRPTVRVGGTDLVVAFSHHALERAADRVQPTWRWSIGGVTDAFTLFEDCLDFEPCTLTGGQPGFTFWENCLPGCFSITLARRILGDRYSPRKSYRYRVGYCPAVVEKGFLKATTLLFPGYRGTPEHSQLLRSQIPRSEKEGLLKETESLDMARLRNNEGVEVFRWFHDHGVPQIAEGRVRVAPQPLLLTAPSPLPISVTEGEQREIMAFGLRHVRAVLQVYESKGNELPDIVRSPDNGEKGGGPSLSESGQEPICRPGRRYYVRPGIDAAQWARSALWPRAEE